MVAHASSCAGRALRDAGKEARLFPGNQEVVAMEVLPVSGGRPTVTVPLWLQSPMQSGVGLVKASAD